MSSVGGCPYRGVPLYCVMCLCSCAVFEEPEDPSTRSFFSEIIASISDVKFSHSGRYILSRDYLTVKVCVCACACVRACVCVYIYMHFSVGMNVVL